MSISLRTIQTYRAEITASLRERFEFFFFFLFSRYIRPLLSLRLAASDVRLLRFHTCFLTARASFPGSVLSAEFRLLTPRTRSTLVAVSLFSIAVSKKTFVPFSSVYYLSPIFSKFEHNNPANEYCAQPASNGHFGVVRTTHHMMRVGQIR